MIIASPLWCKSSSMPEYTMVGVFGRPNPDHMHSLILSIPKRYRFISVVFCTVLPTEYIVRTFQKPTLTSTLGLANGLVRPRLPFGSLCFNHGCHVSVRQADKVISWGPAALMANVACFIQVCSFHNQIHFKG